MQSVKCFQIEYFSADPWVETRRRERLADAVHRITRHQQVFFKRFAAVCEPLMDEAKQTGIGRRAWFHVNPDDAARDLGRGRERARLDVADGFDAAEVRDELPKSASACVTDARNAAASQSRRSQRVAVDECHRWQSSRRLAAV